MVPAETKEKINEFFTKRKLYGQCFLLVQNFAKMQNIEIKWFQLLETKS
jgi:hypothetical protein